MPLIKGTLTLTWSENCVITSMERRAITNTQRDPSPTNAIFKMKDTNMYISIVTLSTKDDNNFQNIYNQDLKELSNGLNTDQK